LERSIDSPVLLTRKQIRNIALCFSALGFGKCWGCGIGHAMHFAMRGEWTISFQHHILGIPAVIIILNRIRQLTFQLIKP